MSGKEIVIFVKRWLIIVAFCVVALLGTLLGRWQSKEWSITNVHRSQQVKGYNYCPYCGEELNSNVTNN